MYVYIYISTYVRMNYRCMHEHIIFKHIKIYTTYGPIPHLNRLNSDPPDDLRPAGQRLGSPQGDPPKGIGDGSSYLQCGAP